MKNFLFIFGLLTLFWSCHKAEKVELPQDLYGKSFTEGLRIEGHEFDSLLIENCTFKNYGLSVGNVNSVHIKNCTFENIKGNGVEVGFIGEAKGIIIENCSFKNIGSNGIDSHERAPDGQVLNCYFENVALSEIGAGMGQPHHGIYWKGRNVTLYGNTFVNGAQPFGNAISVRSSGYIAANKIYNSVKNGIMYYTDHSGGDSLIIENNFVQNSQFYNIIASSNNVVENHNANVIIRFNTLVNSGSASLYVSESFENTTDFQIYGNILVQEEGDYLKSFYDLPHFYTNLEMTKAEGFVDVENGNLHLTNTSQAIGFCNNVVDFPQKDIDGDPRTQTELDAGADEKN